MNLTTAPLRAIGYLRVSTVEQAESEAGVAAQRTAITAAASARGWDLVSVMEDVPASSATLDRPGLQDALRTLDRGKADVLVVSKLDRLSRSVSQGAEVLTRANRRGWALVALDIGIDTTTPAGEMVAHTILSASQYERRMIGVRTREALAEKRAAGVRLGRPQTLPDAVVQRIVDERAARHTLTVIADGLTADAVPTARGGQRWYASSIQAVLRSQRAAELSAPVARVLKRQA